MCMKYTCVKDRAIEMINCTMISERLKVIIFFMIGAPLMLGIIVIVVVLVKTIVVYCRSIPPRTTYFQMYTDSSQDEAMKKLPLRDISDTSYQDIMSRFAQA